jgi:hypothetical protein
MAVLNTVLAPAAQTGQLFHPLLGVENFDPFGIQAGFDPLANQPARQRIDVPLHPDGAARVHPDFQPLARLQTMPRQRPQQGPFLGRAGNSASVEGAEDLPQEGGVVVAAGEVPVATQHQGLIDRLLEAMVPLLHVAVLVALAGLNGLPLQTVVSQQGLIAALECLLPLHPRLDRCRQAIGPVQLRHATEFPQGVLQSFTEALEALREAEGAALPVGVGEHEMVDHVGERSSVDSDAQVGAVGEVAGGQPTGAMELGEEDLLGGAVLGPPAFEPPLQGPQLPIGETAGEAPLQVGEEGLGL